MIILNKCDSIIEYIQDKPHVIGFRLKIKERLQNPGLLVVFGIAAFVVLGSARAWYC